MTTSYQKLIEHFHKIAQIDHASTFLQWDQLVMMPSGGNAARAEALAELAAIRHELLVSPKLQDLIADASHHNTPGNDCELARSLQEMERCRQNAACLPASLVKAKSLAGSKCEHGWRRQREENDWDAFLVNFKEVVNLARQEAKARYAASSHDLATSYDALLELYCTGDSSTLIDEIFNQLRDELPQLIDKITTRQTRQTIYYTEPLPIESQKQLSHKLMEDLGFDFTQGRLDVSSHPFSTGDSGDQRITTRFSQTTFLGALLATAHETGHASYESGLPQKWKHLPIGSARNMCIHESQSLLFEKQLFLSRSFFSFFSDSIHQFPQQTQKYSTEQLWSSCCRVQPSLIRVEADEATYPLHIVLRFEIEKALINGEAEAEDVPEMWNEKMNRYLGLSTAGDYKNGCLQDIHWTDGSFGYFPSYTMGAINAAQLFSAIQKEYNDWEKRLACGDVSFVRSWLGKNIWEKASSMDSQDMLLQATGEGTNPAHFISHLKSRYLENI
jgi:carboxypeptidase Taq